MNDPYGLLASGLSPELAAQLSGLSREQQIAQALMQQGSAPLEAAPVKGRFQASIGAAPAIAKVIQAYLGRQMLDTNDKKMAGLASDVSTRRGQAMTDYQTARDGAPAQSLQLPAPNDDEGNAMPAAIKDAVPGNARQAVMQAMTNPLIANNPVVAADLKKIEPDWTPTKQYNPITGREEHVLVNKNDPTQIKAMGGQKAAEMKPVTTVGPNGQPVTTFVNPNDVKEPIPQPVKLEYRDTGKTVEPVNPYTQTTPLTKTTTPDADMADRRQRELNGILQNGGSGDQIEGMAKLIANGQVPPLSGYALKSPMGIRIMSRAAEINPNLSAVDFNVRQKAEKDFSTGKQGNTVRSFNVALAHLDTLDKAADALGNSDVKALNAVGQAIAAQTGAPAPTNFDAVKKIVGDEIVKAIVGSGGGVSDREEAAKTIARTNSPAQLKGVIGQYKELMRGQLGGLRQQYETSTGRKDFDRFLSADALKTSHANPAGDRSILDQADAILGGSK